MRFLRAQKRAGIPRKIVTPMSGNIVAATARAPHTFTDASSARLNSASRITDATTPAVHRHLGRYGSPALVLKLEDALLYRLRQLDTAVLALVPSALNEPVRQCRAGLRPSAEQDVDGKGHLQERAVVAKLARWPVQEHSSELVASHQGDSRPRASVRPRFRRAAKLPCRTRCIGCEFPWNCSHSQSPSRPPDLDLSRSATHVDP